MSAAASAGGASGLIARLENDLRELWKPSEDPTAPPLEAPVPPTIMPLSIALGPLRTSTRSMKLAPVE